MKNFAFITILAALWTATLPATIVQYEHRGLWQTAVGSVSATTDFTGVVPDDGNLYLQIR